MPSNAARLLPVLLLLAPACSRGPSPAPQTELAKASDRLAHRIDPRCFALPPERLAGMDEPVLLEGAEPSYPLQALAAGAEGRVSAACTITDEGRVVDCEILRSDVPAVDAAVLEALEGRLYCPAMQDAWPVSTYKTFSFRFKLTDDAPVAARKQR